MNYLSLSCRLLKIVNMTAGKEENIPNPLSGITALPEAPNGKTVKIAAVQGERTLRKRLMDMGFIRGSAITIVRRAPLGDPIEVIIRGYHVSLRIEEARGILVKV